MNMGSSSVPTVRDETLRENSVFVYKSFQPRTAISYEIRSSDDRGTLFLVFVNYCWKASFTDPKMAFLYLSHHGCSIEGTSPEATLSN